MKLIRLLAMATCLFALLCASQQPVRVHADACEDAGHKQHRVGRAERADDIGDAEQHQAYQHQPPFSEQVGGRSDQGLHDGE